MTTLAEHMIVAGAENRPPMLVDKTMYNSWQSQNSQIRNKKYAKLTEQEKLKDCDVQATNIVLQGLPPDVYSISKFVTDVKLAKNMYNTNYDQLYAYLSQHEGHANEVRMLCERYLDPLALVANYQTQSNSAKYPQQLSSIPQTTHSSLPYSPTYEAPHHPQLYQQGFQTQLSHTPPSVPQNAYHTPPISQQPQAAFPQLDSGLAVPSFLPGDDLIACLNKAMAFMSTVMASRFPSTNNQLRTSSNPRNQATI
ncbi:hypothetical protein Tco_1426364 [Tanacetum coccineum]